MSSPPPRPPSLVRRTWSRVRGQRWALLLRDAALAGVLFSAAMAWQGRHLPTGEPAPDFTLRTLGGEPVHLSALRGQPVVLSFWAPWCGICGAESSTLSGLQGSLGGSARVLSVAVTWQDEADVRRFVQEHGVDYPVLLGGPELLSAYGVDRFPTTFFVSPEGRLTHATVGYTTRLGLLWRLWL